MKVGKSSIPILPKELYPVISVGVNSEKQITVPSIFFASQVIVFPKFSFISLIKLEPVPFILDKKSVSTLLCVDE